jgi:hypothetical protein
VSSLKLSFREELTPEAQFPRRYPFSAARE